MPREREPIVAVGLLTRSDLAVLGQGFRRVYPLDESTDFAELLSAIDDAEAEAKKRTPGRG